MKHPAEIVLRALLLGQRVKIEGFTYVWQDDQILIVAKRILDWGKATENEEEMLLGTHGHMALGYFIRACEKLKLDEVAAIAATNALAEIAHERGKGREDRLMRSVANERGYINLDGLEYIVALAAVGLLALLAGVPYGLWWAFHHLSISVVAR